MASEKEIISLFNQIKNETGVINANVGHLQTGLSELKIEVKDMKKDIKEIMKFGNQFEQLPKIISRVSFHHGTVIGVGTLIGIMGSLAFIYYRFNYQVPSETRSVVSSTQKG
jgi:hypothetical protein